jgi:hypothetical protein
VRGWPVCDVRIGRHRRCFIAPPLMMVTSADAAILAIARFCTITAELLSGNFSPARKNSGEIPGDSSFRCASPRPPAVAIGRELRRSS